MKIQNAEEVLNWAFKMIAQQLQLNSGLDYSRGDLTNQVYMYKQKLANNFRIIFKEARKKLRESVSKRIDADASNIRVAKATLDKED